MPTIRIPLRLPSAKPDLTSTDGEVERFLNVDWLQALEDASNHPSGHPSSGVAASHRQWNINVTDLPVSFPFAATLLAVHSPAALDGEHRYLLLTQNYALAIMAPDGSLTTLIPDTYSFPGEIRSVAAYGDYILVAAEKALITILFNSSTLSYSLPAEAPAPPNVEFSFSPAILPDYVNRPGDRVSLSLAVDMPPQEEVSAAMLANWLDLGSGVAVSATVRRLVFRAVGRAVENFMEEARRRNVFLSTVKCMASFDGCLPTTRIRVTHPATPANPAAIITSWALHAATLHLQLSLTLIPLTLSANFSVSEEQEIWVNRFSRLNLYVTQQTPVFPVAKGTLAATGLTSYTEPSTGLQAGFAFRFPIFTDAERMAAAAALSEFRCVAAKHPMAAIATPMVLRPADSSDPLFHPQYADLTKALPHSVMATQQGFVLFGGYADVHDDPQANPLKRRRVKLRGSILSSVPKYPFLFRYLTEVSDGEIQTIGATSTSRSSGATGRHPIHLLSTDGIRRLEADGEGGYLNGRLVSTLPVVTPLSAHHADLLFFFAPGGLHSLSLSSAVKATGHPLPNPDGSRADTGENPWLQMLAAPRGDALLLRGPGRTAILDLEDARCVPLTDVSIPHIARHDDSLYTISRERKLQRIEITATEEDATGIALQADATYADILTRPIKLSTYGRRGTRLREVRAASRDVFMILEGSQSLTEWFEIARGYGRIFPLHLPAIRFYRLRARTSADSAALLAAFDFII